MGEPSLAGGGGLGEVNATPWPTVSVRLPPMQRTLNGSPGDHDAAPPVLVQAS